MRYFLKLSNLKSSTSSTTTPPMLCPAPSIARSSCGFRPPPQRRACVLTTRRLHHIQSARSTWRWWLLGVATATACLLLLTIAHTSRHSSTMPASEANTISPAAAQQQDTILLAAVRQRDNADGKAPLYTVHPANVTRMQILLPPSSHNSAYTVQLQGIHREPQTSRFGRSTVCSIHTATRNITCHALSGHPQVPNRTLRTRVQRPLTVASGESESPLNCYRQLRAIERSDYFRQADIGGLIRWRWGHFHSLGPVDAVNVFFLRENELKASCRRAPHLL